MKKSNKIVRGRIADQTGHTDFSDTIPAAVRKIVEVMQGTPKWVYVNGAPFFFENGFDKVDEQNLTDMLDESEDPTFVVAGALEGGKQPAVQPSFD